MYKSTNISHMVAVHSAKSVGYIVREVSKRDTCVLVLKYLAGISPFQWIPLNSVKMHPVCIDLLVAPDEKSEKQQIQ